MAERTCHVCGTSIAHRRPDAVYCGKRCRKWADYHGLSATQVNGSRMGVCELCGSAFTARTASKRFCSERCRKRQEARRLASRARCNGAPPKRESGLCEHCSEPFSYVKRGGPPQRFCSRACAQQARSAPLRARREAMRAQRDAERCRRQALKRWISVLKMDPCTYCGAPSEAIDHITPRAHGGADEWQNYTGACHTCNALKNDKPLLHGLIYVSISRELRVVEAERAMWAS